MNLWQMMMARRGLMDVAGQEELGGGGGIPEKSDVAGKEPGTELNEGQDDASQLQNQNDLDDDLAGLSTDELLMKLQEERKSRKSLVKENMKRKEKERSLSDQLAQYGNIDPAKARQLAESATAAEKARQAAEQEDLERRGEFDAVKKQMFEAHQTELQSERDHRNQVEQENVALRSKLLEMTVGTAFGGSNFLREKALMTPAKARVIYGAHFEVSEDGSVVGYDKPAGAKERAVLVDGTGKPLHFEAAIERILRADPEADALLRSEAKQGAGSQSKATAKVSTPVVKSTMDKLTAGLGKFNK